MKVLKITSVIILLTAKAMAQTTMGLHDCMQFAVEHSTQIAAEDERLSENSIDRRDAWLNALSPSVNASASVTASSGRIPDPETNMYTTLKTIQDSYGIKGEITLFNGFEAVNQIKISKISLLSGKESRKAKQEEICLSTIQHYYNYTYYSKMSELAERQLQNAKRLLQKARRGYELGSNSQQDVLDKEVFEAQAEFKVADYNAMKNKALMDLKSVMFYPAAESLTVDTVIKTANEMQLTDVEQTAQTAIETNSATVAAKNAMEIKHLEFKTSRWQYAPYIGLEAGWNTYHTVYPDNKGMAAPFNDQFKNNAHKYIGVGLSIPLYNRFNKFSNHSRKKSEYKIASYEFEEKRREIENAVYSAYDDAVSAEKSLNAAQKSAELNKRYLEAAQKKFELGTISYIEFNETYNNYLEAQAQYYNALYSYIIKNAVVDYYRGKSYLEQF